MIDPADAVTFTPGRTESSTVTASASVLTRFRVTPVPLPETVTSSTAIVSRPVTLVRFTSIAVPANPPTVTVSIARLFSAILLRSMEIASLNAVNDTDSITNSSAPPNVAFVTARLPVAGSTKSSTFWALMTSAVRSERFSRTSPAVELEGEVRRELFR